MKILNKVKKFKNEASLGITISIIIGILVMINFFSYQIFHRFDLTKNEDYSLSKVTKTLVKNLDDLVTIKAYFSKELPSQYLTLNQEVADILDGYQNYSKGKIKVEFIDPKDDKKLKQNLQQKGVPELQFNVMEKDKFQVVNGYLGLVIEYADKTEIIPVVQDTNNLEYTITSNIKKLTSKTTPIVGFVTSNGSLSLENEISKAYGSLQELYDVRLIDLVKEKNIDKTINTLVIAGPKEKFSQDDLKKIDEFVMNGGSLLLLADGVKVENNLTASKNELDLNKLLNSYGLKLNNDLILDVSSGIASFNQGFITFNINYPFWPKVLKGGFSQDNVATAKLESLTLPWVSSLEKVEGSGGKYTSLLSSTNKAWNSKDNFDLNPQQEYENKSANQYDLAVSIEGKLKSPFGDKTIENGRIIVVSDSDFLRDNFLTMGDNMAFFQNLVDSLSLDQDLISIRAKGVTSHPISGELSENNKLLIRYLNVFGLTVVTVGFGLFRYSSRRKKRSKKTD
ncbi:MAG: hypothetical protein US81_C0005G0011 [Parcubacteria group bacterium GW2011_GWE2_38_18]|nr:MAG: hypothetical protein US81_C0005G0011 [Parcubacteria group bacterium GW2011_GWE2_38_18]